MQCTQSVGNTRVMSCVTIHYIRPTMRQLVPPKFITHKDLDPFLHSFPSCPAVVCGVLWCGLRFSDLSLHSCHGRIRCPISATRVIFYIGIPTFPSYRVAIPTYKVAIPTFSRDQEFKKTRVALMGRRIVDNLFCSRPIVSLLPSGFMTSPISSFILRQKLPCARPPLALPAVSVTQS